jgi:hypothetical protein
MAEVHRMAAVASVSSTGTRAQAASKLGPTSASMPPVYQPLSIFERPWLV